MMRLRQGRSELRCGRQVLATNVRRTVAERALRWCTSIVPGPALAILLTLAISGPVIAVPAHAIACLGDCNADGAVSISELVIGVTIALRQRDVSSCAALDDNRDGDVTVDELIRAVSNALSSCGPENPLDRGLASLAAGDLVSADDAFAAATAARPADAGPRLFHALTRLTTNSFRAPQGMDALGRALVVIRGGLEDVCTLRVEVPSLDALPDGAPRSEEIVDTARSILMPELQASLSDLQRIPSDAVIRFDLADLPACLIGRRRPVTVEIDHGDILALTAALHGAAALLDILSAYDVDLRLQSAAALPVRMLFDSSPNLLTLRSAARLGSARDSLRLGLSALIDAIDAIQAETDDQSDDVLVILPQDADEAGRARQLADLLRQSLNGEVTLPTSLGLDAPERLNLDRFFSARLQSLRGLFAFDTRSDVDAHHFPDPTFAGTAPDLDQPTIDEAIAGGPLCAACETGDDCAAFGQHRMSCHRCNFQCSGDVKRCAPRGFTSCEDGYY